MSLKKWRKGPRNYHWAECKAARKRRNAKARTPRGGRGRS